MSIQWSPTASGVKDWTCIASNLSGQYLVAGTYSGEIWRSSTYGLMWTISPDNVGSICNAITSDSTGQYLAATVNDGQGGNIWLSTNYGANWVNYGLSYLNKKWTSIASNSNGQYLAAATEDGDIWRSSNSGVTWSISLNNVGAKCNAITSDSTGQYLAAATDNGYIWRSSNSGVTWTISQNSVGTKCNAITSDSTGQYLAATVNNGLGQGGNIWLSTNYGESWVNYGLSYLNQNWTSIASNSDGNYLIACSEQVGGNGINSIWYSTDRGISWTQTNTSDTTSVWRTIAINSSGQHIAVAGQNTNIYTGYNQTACFNKGTNILCFVDNEEKYIPIEKLQKGDLVKTYKHGYKKVEKIGKGLMNNNVNKFTECMYKLKKTNTNSLTEHQPPAK
jgi:hypothetical protein